MRRVGFLRRVRDSMGERIRLPLAVALRRTLAEGYDGARFRADLLAGIVVGIVAIPLSMALAMAVGVPPQHGLYTAVVAGALTAVLGGCRFQVSGPTAAFIVILAPIASKHGLGGLLTAGMLAGLILIVLGIANLGSLIRFVPYPVTTGFTTGIAVVIAVLQLRDLFGLETGALPESFAGKLEALWAARGTLRWQEALIAASTFGLLIGAPRLTRRVPAPLIALGVVSIAAVIAHAIWPSFEVATIGSRFVSEVDGEVVRGIPGVPPMLGTPWGDSLSFETVRELLPAAVAIALLGAIESLLSAVIADGMTGTRHDPSGEILGLGIANVVAPFFGGIAATGALARTATNIRAGARSPIASVVHALVVLLAILLLARFLAYVPMASLAALLLLVAWNMSELDHFLGILRTSPRSDVAVLLTCFVLTVMIDMVAAVTIGFSLAALLFMHRMSVMTRGHFVLDGTADDLAQPTEAGILQFKINGPLFFGAAEQALAVLERSHTDTYRILVLDLGHVGVIDATGYAALVRTISKVVSHGRQVILAGPLPGPSVFFERGLLEAPHPNVLVASDLDAALETARSLRDAMVSREAS